VRDVPRVLVPIVLGGLELVHPSWADGSVAEAVAATHGTWVPLHVALIVGFAALAWTLDVPRRPVRVLEGAFVVCNAAYLAIDGVAVGLLAQRNPGAADALWNSPGVTVLADLAGASWAATLLAVAAARSGPVPAVAGARSGPVLAVAAKRSGPARVLGPALGLVWLLFVAGSVLPYVAVIGRGLALIIAAAAVYTRGTPGLGFALLLLAAVSRQHVGAEAAFGMLCLALAATIELRGRSSPAAVFRRGPG
jgi:hypothetical protein